MNQQSLFSAAAPPMRSDAHVSECGTYRYWLSRVWDEDVPPVCFIMLNPSTADATQDDPTIGRCVGFARREGAGGVYVVNLFALRSTDPAALLTHPDPVGPENDWAIRCNAGASVGCSRRLHVVAAWGAHGKHMGRDAAVKRMLADYGTHLQCLGTTKDGSPRHPLYVRADQPLVPLD